MFKQNIRKKFLKKRKKEGTEDQIINITKIINILKKLYKPVIGGYYPVNYEIDCINILKRIEEKGYQISLPVIKKNNQMEFYSWSLIEPLTFSKFGIPQPKNLIIVYPDVLFVPMVAFDKYKYRIGYGGGYYDRYIQKNKKKKLLLIGIAFSFQQTKKIPINKYDKKVDFIITEKSIIK